MNPSKVEYEPSKEVDNSYVSYDLRKSSKSEMARKTTAIRPLIYDVMTKSFDATKKKEE